MVDIALPAGFTRNVERIWGADGRAWLAGLPGLAEDLLREWNLRLAGPFPLSINWVGRVRRADGSTAVLKLGMPESGHLAVEATALDCFAGRGAVTVLARDDARGALLLEEARPGAPLRHLAPHRDEEATAAIISVVKRLHRPAPDGVALPELSARRETFARHLRRFPADDPLPRHMVERAWRLLDELCATATGRVVMEQLADGLGMPLDRVVAWGFVQAVLSEVWTAEGDGVLTGRPLRLALRLLPALP